MAHHEFAPYLDPGLGVDGGSIWLKLETLLVVDVLVHCIPVVLPVSRISCRYFCIYFLITFMGV